MFKRPMPPDEWSESNHHLEYTHFRPAPEVWDWISHNILDPDGKIYNADHEHLIGQTGIAILWASSHFNRQGRSVMGQCESVMFQSGGWKRERQELQMIKWFGFVPKFIITLAANFCHSCSDIEFCALVDHELYHLMQKQGAYGPAFSKTTGLPLLTIRGHDVEEFVGVVRRYGASDQVKELVDVANDRPTIARADIAHSCGTCLLRVV